MRKAVSLLLALLMLAALALTGCDESGLPTAEEINTVISIVESLSDGEPDAGEEPLPSEPEKAPDSSLPDEHGSYTSREDVAAYLIAYGHLPENFITKKDARALGWEGGSLEDFAPGKCIGGDFFGNYEGLLPSAKGRKYTECDIDTLGRRSRGSKRLIFSNDGLIYYTEDHYESFTLLYGEEDR